MAKIAPMLGSLISELGNSTRGSDKKRAVKPKTTKGHKAGGRHMVTHGEGSVTNHGQQHGELPSYSKPTQHALMKEHAKGEMRRATESWISGHMTTQEHSAVHNRARHVLAGRHPHEYKGKSGERKHPSGLR